MRGITILALALGSLAAITVQALGHIHSGHASVCQPPSNVRFLPTVHQIKPPLIIGRPWMY